MVAFLLAGCAPRSSIDAKKTGLRAESGVNKNASAQLLSDKDIFGNETTLAVSEEDIQAALEEDEFRVPLNSPVILVQSGSRAPETAMQQEMRKYYTVATFSGIPDRQKVISCNKNENGDVVVSENMNWMQALRYVGAKGHQKAIVVYQDT
ncbi:aminopeptidase, partial [Candidatus Magnetobacterium bavaricum]